MSRATAKSKTSKKSGAAKVLLNSAHGKVTGMDARSEYPTSMMGGRVEFSPVPPSKKSAKKRGRPNYKAQIEALRVAGIESERKAATFDSMHSSLLVMTRAACALVEAGEYARAHELLREAIR